MNMEPLVRQIRESMAKRTSVVVTDPDGIAAIELLTLLKSEPGVITLQNAKFDKATLLQLLKTLWSPQPSQSNATPDSLRRALGSHPTAENILQLLCEQLRCKPQTLFFANPTLSQRAVPMLLCLAKSTCVLLTVAEQKAASLLPAEFRILVAPKLTHQDTLGFIWSRIDRNRTQHPRCFEEHLTFLAGDDRTQLSRLLGTLAQKQEENGVLTPDDLIGLEPIEPFPKASATPGLLLLAMVFLFVKVIGWTGHPEMWLVGWSGMSLMILCYRILNVGSID